MGDDADIRVDDAGIDEEGGGGDGVGAAGDGEDGATGGERGGVLGGEGAHAGDEAICVHHGRIVADCGGGCGGAHLRQDRLPGGGRKHVRNMRVTPS